MNIKFFTFALISGLAVAHPPPPPPPDCKSSNVAHTCTLPDGKEGMFICLLPPPPHPHHGGGIGGAILGFVDHIIGPPPSDDEKHTGPPHRNLRSGHGGPHHEHEHHHRHGDSRKGPHHHPYGPHHPPHGPPDFLSNTICVPTDGPSSKDHPFPPPPPPPPPPFPHPHPFGPPPPPPTCGCCGDICPQTLECGCTCDLIDFRTNSVQKDGGVWVAVTVDHEEQPMRKCVPKGAYADANRVQCVTECPAQNELLEEDLEDALEEKESRD